MAACVNGSLPILNLLIEYRILLDTANKYGQTPLHIAIRRGFTLAVQALLSSGVDTKKGYPALHQIEPRINQQQSSSCYSNMGLLNVNVNINILMVAIIRERGDGIGEITHFRVIGMGTLVISKDIITVVTINMLTIVIIVRKCWFPRKYIFNNYHCIINHIHIKMLRVMVMMYQQII